MTQLTIILQLFLRALDTKLENAATSLLYTDLVFKNRNEKLLYPADLMIF